MSSNNIVSKLIIPMVFVGGTAYYLYKNSMKEKVHLDCQDHLSLLINRDKLLQIIEDILWGFLVNTLVQMCSGRFPLTQPFVKNCFLDFYWTTSASLLVRAVLNVEEHFRKCTFGNSSKQVICEDIVVRSLVNHFCQPLRASTFENIRALLKVYFLHFW